LHLFAFQLDPADPRVFVPVNLIRIAINLEPRAAFLDPFCCQTVIISNQTLNLAYPFALCDDARLRQHPRRKFLAHE
jgi:hypothetical protein